jgi:hypothetical protein
MPKVDTEESVESKPLEPVQLAPVVETVQDDKLYVPSIINVGLSVSFHQAGKNMDAYFLAHAAEHLEGKCWKEGFVRPGFTKVLSYTAGRLHGTTIEYQILYLVDVCFPYEGMEVDCIIRNVNKIGIRATVREKQNPMVLYVTREHNPIVLMEEYKPGQKIKVRVLGHRFEQGDSFIGCLAELILVKGSTEKVKVANPAENPNEAE